MARIRTVKPEFFKHYDLFKAEEECGLPLRVAFSGLWCCADKEGRFKWQPAQLKLDVLPYDDVNFEDVLNVLERHEFIVKYSVDNKWFGCIPTLPEHQRFSGKEAQFESKLPPPPGKQSGSNREATGKQPGRHEEALSASNKSLTDSFTENKGGKQPGSTGEALGNPGKEEGKERIIGKEEGKEFPSHPLPSDMNGLPEIKIGGVIELIWHTKNLKITNDKVLGLWNVFKIQNLTGKKFYANESDVQSHFINWIKKQDFEKIQTIINKSNPVEDDARSILKQVNQK
jgi:hypothetical protein